MSKKKILLTIPLLILAIFTFFSIVHAQGLSSLNDIKDFKDDKMKYRMTKNNGNNVTTYTQQVTATKQGNTNIFKIEIDKAKDGKMVICIARSGFDPISVRSYNEQNDLQTEGIYKNGKYVNKEIPTGKTADTGVDDDVIDYNALPFILQAFPFGKSTKLDFHLLINSTTQWPKQFPVTVKYVGKDDVTTPAGKFNCYKLEVAPGGLLGLVAPKKARSYLYYTVEDEPILVKYESKFDNAMVELIDK